MVKSKAATTMLLLATLVGCHSGDMSEKVEKDSSGRPEKANSSAELPVEVFYRERMMLPPAATLEVVLEDSAKMDAAAELVARKQMVLKGGPPYRVALQYDPSKLHGRGKYGVRARIDNEGQLMFTSTQFNPAFGTDGSYGAPPNDPVKVLVQRVAARQTSGTSLTGTRWIFQTLRGRKTGVGAGGKAPDLTLQGAEPRISGFAGCNRVTGSYELEGSRLSFSKLAMTRKACPNGMELEREVAKVLEDTKRYTIVGNELRLMAEDGTLVAELKAQ